MQIEANIRINMNGKKINCIKEVRDFSGLSLTDAKNLVETRDGYRVLVRMTDTQFGRLMGYVMGARDKSDYGYPDTWPTYEVTDIRRIEASAIAYDFTANTK